MNWGPGGVTNAYKLLAPRIFAPKSNSNQQLLNFMGQSGKKYNKQVNACVCGVGISNGGRFSKNPGFGIT